jgi:hypothetical protein
VSWSRGALTELSGFADQRFADSLRFPLDLAASASLRETILPDYQLVNSRRDAEARRELNGFSDQSFAFSLPGRPRFFRLCACASLRENFLFH